MSLRAILTNWGTNIDKLNETKQKSKSKTGDCAFPGKLAGSSL